MLLTASSAQPHRDVARTRALRDWTRTDSLYHPSRAHAPEGPTPGVSPPHSRIMGGLPRIFFHAHTRHARARAATFFLMFFTGGRRPQGHAGGARRVRRGRRAGGSGRRSQTGGRFWGPKGVFGSSTHPTRAARHGSRAQPGVRGAAGRARTRSRRFGGAGVPVRRVRGEKVLAGVTGRRGFGPSSHRIYI